MNLFLCYKKSFLVLIFLFISLSINNYPLFGIIEDDDNWIDEISLKSSITTNMNFNFLLDSNINRIFVIDSDSFFDVLKKSNRKKIVHFYGTWCPILSLGLDSIKRLITHDTSYTFFLVACDINTKGQKEMLRKYLYNIGIVFDSYIIFNEIKELDDIFTFRTGNHILNFIQTFDPNYRNLKLPYTVLFDEKNNVIYKYYLEIDDNLLFSDNPTQDIKYEIDFKLINEILTQKK